MDFWDAVVAIISYILGGLTVHVYHNCKKKTVSHSDNIIGGNADISAGGDSVVAKEYKKTVYFSGAPAKKIPEPSEQAKSFMKQLVENNGETFVTFEELGIVRELLITNANKTMNFVDDLSIKDDLEVLEENGYIKHLQENSSGHIYNLTLKGRNYGRSLISAGAT